MVSGDPISVAFTAQQRYRGPQIAATEWYFGLYLVGLLLQPHTSSLLAASDHTVSGDPPLSPPVPSSAPRPADRSRTYPQQIAAAADSSTVSDSQSMTPHTSSVALQAITAMHPVDLI